MLKFALILFILIGLKMWGYAVEPQIDLVTISAQSGQVKELDALLQGGISPNGHDEIPNAPLYYAIMLDYPDCVYLLLKHGVDPNLVWGKDESPALSIAAQNRATRCASLLLQFGADINRVDKKGFSPMYRAKVSGDERICKLFQLAGAKPLTEEETQGLHPTQDLHPKDSEPAKSNTSSSP